MRFFILALLLIFITPIPALAERNCLGTETVEQLQQNAGRFTHCEKGDVISVYTTVLKEALPNPTDLNDIRAWGLRENEVSANCSFNYPIIFLGETEMDATALIGQTLRTKQRWYSCIYLGVERETALSKETSSK